MRCQHGFHLPESAHFFRGDIDSSLQAVRETIKSHAASLAVDSEGTVLWGSTNSVRIVFFEDTRVQLDFGPIALEGQPPSREPQPEETLYITENVECSRSPFTKTHPHAGQSNIRAQVDPSVLSARWNLYSCGIIRRILVTPKTMGVTK